MARFNGRIRELVCQAWFKTETELEATLLADGRTYHHHHHHTAERALEHLSAEHTLQKRQLERPDLFNTGVCAQAVLDTEGAHGFPARMTVVAGFLNSGSLHLHFIGLLRRMRMQNGLFTPSKR